MRIAKFFSVFIFLCLLIIISACRAGIPVLEPAVRIIGVTEGSVYTGYAKILYYPSDSTVYISRNGADEEEVSFGQVFSTEGSYRLRAWKSDEEPGIAVINFSIDKDPSATTVYRTNNGNSGAYLEISVEPGYSSAIPVYALWAEDLAGNFLQDIFISTYPATNIPKNGTGHVDRKESLPYWMHKAGKEVFDGVFLSDAENNIPSDLDAVTGATIDDDQDFTIMTFVSPNPSDGNQVRICYEIQQSWDFGWYFTEDGGTGVIDAHDTIAEPSLVYSAIVDLETAGTYDLGGTASAAGPAGYGEYLGENGTMYTDFYKPDPLGAGDRYIFDNAPEMTEKITVTVIDPI